MSYLTFPHSSNYSVFFKPLIDIPSIDALTRQQATAYLVGYNLPPQHAIADQKEQLPPRLALGVQS